MQTNERARSLRDEGVSLSKIALALGISKASAHYQSGGSMHLDPPAEDERRVVKHYAYNGGCSTTSGLAAISIPRIEALHGAFQ